MAAASVAWELRGSTELVVTTAEVSTGTIERRIVASGTLAAIVAVEVRTQVSGTIESLNADFNSVVTAGQVLARLGSASVDAQLREAEAERRAAEADLSGAETAAGDARAKLSRAGALAAAKMIPGADFDAAKATLVEATADVAAAESAAARASAAVDRATAIRDQTIIRSPIDGIVVSRNVDVGQTVAATLESPALFTIASDLKHMRLKIDVDQVDVDGVHPGDAVTFKVAAYSRQTFRGTVTELSLQPAAAAGATAVRYTMMIDVANVDVKLRPGQRVTVKFNGSRHDNVVRIPNSALSFRPPADILTAIAETEVPAIDAEDPAAAGELRQVWEYDGKQFIGITVRTGLSDDMWTELMSGSVNAGDFLATSAAFERRSRD